MPYSRPMPPQRISSWLAGVALSTTSVAVVYTVMLELGFNKTEFGKGIRAACFVNDLGVVIALGLIFAPFMFQVNAYAVPRTTDGLRHANWCGQLPDPG